jgi:AraC family transcriptional regulator
VDDGVGVARGEVGGFCITELRFPARYAQAPFDPERGYLAIVLDGCLDKMFRARSLSLGGGTVATIPSCARHAALFGEGGARVLVLHPPPDPERPYRGLLSRVDCRADAGLTALATRLAAELRAPDEAAPVAAEGLALELLAAAVRSRDAKAPAARPAWLSGVVELLHDPGAGPLGLSDAARAASVHPAHLARVFRRHFGVSVGTYVRRVRLDRAAARLARSATPIACIAAEEGFADQSHFTRAFKRHTGVSPARYRRLTQG